MLYLGSPGADSPKAAGASGGRRGSRGRERGCVFNHSGHPPSHAPPAPGCGRGRRHRGQALDAAAPPEPLRCPDVLEDGRAGSSSISQEIGWETADLCPCSIPGAAPSSGDAPGGA